MTQDRLTDPIDGFRAPGRRRALMASGAAAAALASAALLAAAADAQDADAEDGSEEGTEIITVYGTSNPLPVFDYPGQVSVVSREEIETFAPSAISDALRDLPGVEFSGGPRRTGEVPSIRGLSGENLLILLDGARQSFISAHDGRFFIDPDLIRSAEAVRGPASALYGSGAVGGVLAFETVDAADFLRSGEDYGAQIRLGYQDVNEEVLASFTAFGRFEKLDLVANIATRDSGDIDLGSGFTLESDDDITNTLLKAEYEVTDALRVEGSWTRFNNEAFEPNNGQGVAPPGDPTLGADVEKDITSDNLRGAIAFNPAQNPWIDARFTAYRVDSEVDEFDASLPRTTVRDIQTTGVNVRNASRFSLGGVETAFTVGGDWYRDEQEGTDDNADDGTRNGVPNGEATFFGVFAQIEAQIDQPLGLPGELLIVPGVRFDSYESEIDGFDETNDDDAVSPRIAASYGPVEWFRGFASFSEGFRAPSINELFLDGPHFPLPHPVLFDPTGFPPSFVFVNNNFVPNPNLEAEKSETVEVGFGLDFRDVAAAGDRFQGKISYYETEVEDLINLFVDMTFDPTCFAPPTFFPCTAGTTNSANLDNAELSGVEFEALYDAPRVRLRATYSTVEGEDTATGADLGTLTPDRFALDARWKLPAYQAAVGARLQTAGDFEQTAFQDGAITVIDERDGYAVVDLYGTWRPAFFDGLRIDAGVDNVFDEDYERVFEGVSEPGINPRVAVTYRLAFGAR